MSLIFVLLLCQASFLLGVYAGNEKVRTWVNGKLGPQKKKEAPQEEEPKPFRRSRKKP